MQLPEALQELVENLNLLGDRTERIQALISIADRFVATVRERPFDESHRVPGCESEVFAWVSAEGCRLRLDYAVENPQGISAMAMAVILQDALNGRSPAEAQQVPDEVVYEIFGNELSMGKSMGLMGMVRMTKHLARQAHEALKTV